MKGVFIGIYSLSNRTGRRDTKKASTGLGGPELAFSHYVFFER